MGRAIAGFFLTLVAVGVLIGIGTEIYQAGVAQGIVDAGRFPAAAPVPVAGYGGYHGGFNILGLFFPLLFLFVLFGLIRAAFSRGRGWGHGYGHGYRGGWGSGWDKGPGEGGPSSWREEREQRMADLHRRMHESEGNPGSGGTGSGAAGGSPAT